MDMIKKETSAAAYFHNKTHNWNCAQSILKAYQYVSGLEDEELELSYRSKGGGRAEGGLCGAIYAASLLVEKEGTRTELLARFESRTGGLTCAQLKGKCGRSCQELVAVADEELGVLLGESKR